MQKVDVKAEYLANENKSLVIWRLRWSVANNGVVALVIRNSASKQNHAVVRMGKHGDEFSKIIANTEKLIKHLDREKNPLKKSMKRPVIRKYGSAERLAFDFPELKRWREETPEAFRVFDSSLDGFVAREVEKAENKKVIEAVTAVMTIEEDQEMLGSW